MTALKKYQKLECPGLWRESNGAHRREVVVAFGEASLVLSDPRSASALSHWSLPAVQRLNPGALPALYATDAGTDEETLEIDDATMIGAIETVRGAIAHARARPGRLRSGLSAVVAMAILLLTVFWLPRALIAQTAAMVPVSKRAEIGRMALQDMSRVTGLPCSDDLGLKAAEQLSDRVTGADGGQIMFVRDGVQTSASLPGGIILLSRHLVEDRDSPEAAAGFAIAERLRAGLDDPLVPLLRHAGLLATFRLLTTGTLPAGAVDGYAETALLAAPKTLPEPLLLDAFQTVGVASSPFAYALDPTGESVLGLIEADPFRAAKPPPVLPDAEWISLQSVCRDQ